jgi:hypothetical protein
MNSLIESQTPRVWVVYAGMDNAVVLFLESCMMQNLGLTEFGLGALFGMFSNLKKST